MEHRQVDIVTAKKSRCRKRGYIGAHGRRPYQTMQTLHSTNLLVQFVVLAESEYPNLSLEVDQNIKQGTRRTSIMRCWH